jgi:hypothetical protein
VTYVISKEVDSVCMNCTQLGHGCTGGKSAATVSMSCQRTPSATWNSDRGGFTIAPAPKETE